MLGVLLAMVACGRASTTSKAQGPATEAPALAAVTADQVLQKVREPGAKAVVINVWATWCTPCREEFPDLMQLRREYERRGLRLVLVSADFPDQTEEARRFLTQQGVDFPTFLKTGKDMEFINGLDERWSGALPATFVYDARGALRSFREGRTTHAVMESLVVAAMTPQ
jgi:thiol-disulfide isomerase/thioredoxin